MGIPPANIRIRTDYKGIGGGRAAGGGGWPHVFVSPCIYMHIYIYMCVYIYIHIYVPPSTITPALYFIE